VGSTKGAKFFDIDLKSFYLCNQNCQFYVPATHTYRTSGSFDLFPTHCLLPTFTPAQHVMVVYDKLVKTIKQMKKQQKQNYSKI